MLSSFGSSSDVLFAGQMAVFARSSPDAQSRDRALGVGLRRKPERLVVPCAPDLRQRRKRLRGCSCVFMYCSFFVIVCSVGPPPRPMLQCGMGCSAWRILAPQAVGRWSDAIWRVAPNARRAAGTKIQDWIALRGAIDDCRGLAGHQLEQGVGPSGVSAALLSNRGERAHRRMHA